MAKLKFAKMPVFPGFPAGYRTEIPEFGTVELLNAGTGNVEVEWTNDEGDHVLVQSVPTPRAAFRLCQRIADEKPLRDALLAGIEKH